MRRIQLSAVAITVVATTAFGAVSNVLRRACADAEAVVVGAVQPVSLDMPRFTLIVDTVIRGDFNPGVTVLLSWPGRPLVAQFTPPDRGLWFLRQSSPGVWEIMPVGGRNAPLFASALAVPPRGKPDIDLSSASTCYEAVWSVLKASAPHIDESLAYVTAMKTLLRNGPDPESPAMPAVDAAVQEFAQSPSPALKALALSYRIKGGDVSALVRISGETSGIAKSYVAAEVGSALAEWYGTDPAGVAALGAIAESTGAGPLRQQAAEALMRIHTKEAVPAFIKLLASDDPPLRDAAVRGLSLFVRGAPVLSPANVRAMAYFAEGQNKEFLDEGIAPYVTAAPVPSDRWPEYRDAWLAWWARMSDKLGAANQD